MGRLNSFTPKEDVIGKTRDGRSYLIAPAGIPISQMRAIQLGLMPGPSEYKAIVSLEPKNDAPVEIDATDAAVALAKEHGIDLSIVIGSGANGRIVKSDVEALLEG